MDQHTLTVTLLNDADTDQLGKSLAVIAQAGDCILLKGQIGAGKSAFARAFIRQRLGPDTEVPSPTFTLVQTYGPATLEIWHADLYRLSDPQEAVELGLTDAFADHICLIEWPELLEGLVPDTALDIHLSVTPDAHIATLTYGNHWASRLRCLDT